MKKANDFEVTYVYSEPKTPKEKADQQKKLDEVFDDIFENILKDRIRK